MKRGDMVGVRELRQNLSKYLRRVTRGETLRVTERGHPVAVLAPLPEEESVLGRLERQGKLRRARISLPTLGQPENRPHTRSISDALAEQRADR